MTSTANQAEFHIRTGLENPKMSLVFKGLKKDIPEKGLVIYSPGMRSVAGWSNSKSLGGMYQYVGPLVASELVVWPISGITELLHSGLVLSLSTFGPIKDPLSELVGSVGIEIRGFTRDTCIETIESIEYQTTGHNRPAVQKQNWPLDKPSRIYEGATKNESLRSFIKGIPGAKEAYSKYRKFDGSK